MNKHIPRSRKPFSRSDDEDYKFEGSPLARKAADKTLTKRARDGASPGKHGVKSPYPPIITEARTARSSKYMPHQGKRERARRAAKHP